MEDDGKTKNQLLEELSALRERISELEESLLWVRLLGVKRGGSHQYLRYSF